MSYSLSFSQAILAVMYIGDKVAQGFYDFVPTKEIAESLNISRPTLVKIMQGLHSAGIIETREGAKGGVRLAKQPQNITLLDIFTAIESGRPLFRSDFTPKVSGKKPTRAQEELLSIFTASEMAMQAALNEKTIADLLFAINQ